MKRKQTDELRSTDGISYPYLLRRSNRRTISAEVRPNGELVVRAPFSMPAGMIDAFLLQHQRWISKHMERPRKEEPTETEKAALIQRAKAELPPLVEQYSKIMELYPNRIRITGAKTRYGSCSSKNDICFSWRLMQYPLPAIEYVVVHELAHIRHKNHGRDFYGLIQQILPDHKERKQLLR